MAGNTGASIQENQTFTTGVVSVVTGVLNPPNSPQTTWDCGVGMTYAAMTTSFPSAPGTVTIVLEGTYDGTNWTVLATTTNTAGETVYSTGIIPFTNLRARCTAVTGGASPTVNVYATASEQPFTLTTGGTIPSLTVGQGGGSLNGIGWLVAEGAINPAQNLTNATTTTTGAVADFGSARQSATFQVLAGAGVTAGAVTFFGSIDNTTFTPLTTASILGSTTGNSITAGVLSFTTAGNALVSPGAAGNNMNAMRYYRADVTTSFVGGNVNVKVSAF